MSELNRWSIGQSYVDADVQELKERMRTLEARIDLLTNGLGDRILSEERSNRELPAIDADKAIEAEEGEQYD